VKKCASCTKDLPDAALHCVFCGAKQPPAPAVQQGLAKTAFGYSANEMVEQLRQQGGPAARPGAPQPPAPAANPSPASPIIRPPAPAFNQPPAPAFNQPPASAFNQSPAFNPTAFNAPPAPAFNQPPNFNQPPAPAPNFNQPPAPAPNFNQPPAPAFNQPTFAPQRAGTPPPPTPYTPPPGYPPAPPGPPGGFVPASASNAATMFVPGGPAATPAPSPAAQHATVQVSAPPSSYGPPASAMQPTLVPPPPQPQPQPQLQSPPRMPIPASQPPPYLASHTASRIGRPVDPWKDSLRLMMFFWGVALLAVFATPLRTTGGLVFNWNLILDGAGTARLPPLMFAAIGLLSVIVSGIPMQPAARGVIAAVLGLAGVVVPVALVGVPPWQSLVSMIGMLLLVPSLLVRSEYRGATVPRVLVTLGAIAILLPYLVPQNGAIPLVSLFKGLMDLPGSQKALPALALGLVTIVVMSLLAWLPAPVTGGATLWAWLLILWALILHATVLLLAGNIGDTITGTPNAAIVSWIAGGTAPSGLALGSAYLVLVGYGLASVIGKQLE
jgi:hypothetical protein